MMAKQSWFLPLSLLFIIPVALHSVSASPTTRPRISRPTKIFTATSQPTPEPTVPTNLPATNPTLPTPTNLPTTNPTLPPAFCPTSCSPGVTALEYLGTGYNIIEGNPRGGTTSDVDPGFRKSVIRMIQTSASKSLDGAFLVPLGTDFHYRSACRFMSASVEVANAQQYQQMLSQEATMTQTISQTTGFLFFTFTNEMMFTQSSSYQAFASARSQTQTTTFESTAVCTEFEASLDRYYPQSLQSNFMNGINSLVPWDPTNNATVQIYRNFLNEFGTHYVSKVVLGAKQHFSTTFRSTDVAAFQAAGQSIATAMDSKSSFSFDGAKAIPGFNLPAGDKPAAAAPTTEAAGGENAAAAASAAGRAIPQAAILTAILQSTNVQQTTTNGNTATLTTQQQRFATLQTMARQTIEVNIGGRPAANGDWHSWAATAGSRPMPILYQLSGLVDLMSPTVAQWFTQALIFFYTTPNANLADLGRAVAFGVVNRDGIPLSPYTLDPLSGLRSIVTRGTPPAISGASVPPYQNYMIRLDTPSDYVSAVFATPIRGSVTPNALDETAVSQATYPTFAQSLDANTISVAVDSGHRINVDANSFSFLTVTNLMGVTGILSGLVHPDGYIVSEVFPRDPGFQVSQERDLTYDISFSTNFTATPTFLVTPNVFIREGQNATAILDVSSAFSYLIISTVRSCSTSGCRINIGPPITSLALFPQIPRNLGFSFLAIDGALNIDPMATRGIGLVHGFVNVTVSNPGSPAGVNISWVGQGFSAYAQYSPATQDALDVGFVQSNFPYTPLVGGVKIVFNTPFQAIPSVITTAQPGVDIGGPQFNPDVVVEHITRRETLIKNFFYVNGGNIFGSSQLYPISFHFVAIGPVSLKA